MYIIIWFLHGIRISTDTCIQAVIILSDIPQSRNVSAGTLVKFTCATPEIGLTAFTITTDLTLGNAMSNDVVLPNGGRQLTLSFIALSTSGHQLITIACIATKINTMGMVKFNTSTAILMIQGRNTTYEYNVCSYTTTHSLRSLVWCW